MKIHFQNDQTSLEFLNTCRENCQKKKVRNKIGRSNKNCKYVGVRQRASGKWVAEIKDTTQRIRMWLGTFDTSEEAARAYDEAACLLRGSNTRTNFPHCGGFLGKSTLSLKIKNQLIQKKNNVMQKQNITSCATSLILHSSDESVKSESNGNYSPVSVFEKLQKLENAYRPDLSNCNGELEKGSCLLDHIWPFPNGFDFDLLGSNDDESNVVPTRTSNDLQITTEYDELMKVQRQISASLYAINGVNEYLEQKTDNNNDDIWDLQNLYKLFCGN